MNREIKQMANEKNEITNESVMAYLKRRKKGITKRGVIYWVIERIQMGGVPFFGGPKMIDVEDDPVIGLPESLREG